EELPYLEEIAQAHPEWNVVGVHADRNAGNGAAFLNDLGVDLPSYQDDSNLFAGTLSLPGVIPITLLVVVGEVKERFIQPLKSTEKIELTITTAQSYLARIGDMAEYSLIADSPGVNTTLPPENSPHWWRSALDVTGEDVVEIIGKRAQ